MEGREGRGGGKTGRGRERGGREKSERRASASAREKEREKERECVCVGASVSERERERYMDRCIDDIYTFNSSLCDPSTQGTGTTTRVGRVLRGAHGCLSGSSHDTARATISTHRVSLSTPEYPIFPSSPCGAVGVRTWDTFSSSTCPSCCGCAPRPPRRYIHSPITRPDALRGFVSPRRFAWLQVGRGRRQSADPLYRMQRACAMPRQQLVPCRRAGVSVRACPCGRVRACACVRVRACLCVSACASVCVRVGACAHACLWARACVPVARTCACVCTRTCVGLHGCVRTTMDRLSGGAIWLCTVPRGACWMPRGALWLASRASGASRAAHHVAWFLLCDASPRASGA